MLFLLVATPLCQILRDGDIQFTPALLPHKQRALELISFSDAAKVLLKFRQRPWPKDLHGVVCSGAFVPEMWTNQTTVPATFIGTEGVVPPQEYMLTAFATGERCAEWKALPRATLIARVLAQADTVFSSHSRRDSVSGSTRLPRASEVFVAAEAHFWSDAPFVRGAYTCPHKDEPLWARAALQECHAGRVFFAGTSTNNDTTPNPVSCRAVNAVFVGLIPRCRWRHVRMCLCCFRVIT